MCIDTAHLINCIFILGEEKTLIVLLFTILFRFLSSTQYLLYQIVPCKPVGCCKCACAFVMGLVLFSVDMRAGVHVNPHLK